MDVGHLLRAARQQRGLSQRDLARLAGVSHSVVAHAETDGANPSWRLVQQLLAAADADVALTPTPRLPNGVEDWLSASTSARLHWVLTGRNGHHTDNASAAWVELRQLATQRHVVLSPELSTALWLPDRTVARPAATCLVGHDPRRRALPHTSSWDVQVGPVRLEGLVKVGVSVRWEVLAHPPHDPRLHSDMAVSQGLLAVAALLDTERKRDRQGRRPAPHKDSRVLTERSWVAHHRRWLGVEDPSPLERRDWRLGGEASFRQWMLLRGYPLRPDDDPDDGADDDELSATG